MDSHCSYITVLLKIVNDQILIFTIIVESFWFNYVESEVNKKQSCKTVLSLKSFVGSLIVVYLLRVFVPLRTTCCFCRHLYHPEGLGIELSLSFSPSVRLMSANALLCSIYRLQFWKYLDEIWYSGAFWRKEKPYRTLSFRIGSLSRSHPYMNVHNCIKQSAGLCLIVGSGPL